MSAVMPAGRRTMRQRKADNRRDLHERRLKDAPSLKSRLTAAVGWIMAEVYKAADPEFEVDRLAEWARGLNNDYAAGRPSR